jgi:hypothetical protein
MIKGSLKHVLCFHNEVLSRDMGYFSMTRVQIRISPPFHDPKDMSYVFMIRISLRICPLFP